MFNIAIDCDLTFEASCSSSEPHLLTQRDLNYLVCDLNLSKKEAEILASRLKGWNLLQQGTKVCFFRSRQDECKCFFSQENDIVFCNDICSVMKPLDISTIHQSGACSLTPQKLA
jgi:hypothetical protein